MNLSEYLSYTCIANDTILSLKKNRITSILEMYVSTIECEEIMQNRHDRVMKLLMDFPDDSIVSIYFTKNFINQDISYVNNHQNKIINFLEKKRNETLLARNPSTFKCFMALSIPLTESKVDKGGIEILNILSSSSNSDTSLDVQRSIIKKAKKRLDSLVNGFKNSVDNRAFRLNSTQIAQFLSLMLNHTYLDNFTEFSDVFKSDFISSYNNLLDNRRGGFVYYGGNYHAVLSLRAYGKESCLPQYSSPKLNQIFLKESIKDIPYTIHQVIKFPNRLKGLNIAKGRRNRITVQSGLSKNISFLAKTPEGVPPEELKVMIDEAISHVEAGGNRFLYQQFQVHLWANSIKELEDKVSEFNSTVVENYSLKREKYNIKGAYYSIFPGNEDSNPIDVMMPSYNVSDFLLIDMPRFCYPSSKSNNFIYYYTKEDQLTKVDLFDKRADNWNAIVCGGSGSGKSFVVNDILCQYSVYNPQIAIVDYGGVDAGSYRNFISNNNGTYLEINLDSKNFSINPFDGYFFVRIETDEEGREVKIPDINGNPDALKSVSLIATIDKMVSDGGKDGISGIVKSELFTIICKYYKEKNNNLDNSCSLNEFAQKYLKDNSKLVTAGRDIYKELFYFIGEESEEGPYARFFQKTNEIKSKDFICFDLSGLKGHQNLKSVLIPTLLEMICNNILNSSEKNRKKLLVMDEAWTDLKGGAMADFMEEMFRTIRKLNGSITIITQRFLDVLNSTIGGALLANTSYYWFIGNKHDSEPLFSASASSSQGKLSLTNYDIESIMECKSKRDFYLLTPFFSGLLKFYPSKEFALLATTDPDEKNIILKHKEKLGVNYVTPEVIESVLNDKK